MRRMAIVHEQARAAGLACKKIGGFEGLELGQFLGDLGDVVVRKDVGNGSEDNVGRRSGAVKWMPKAAG